MVRKAAGNAKADTSMRGRKGGSIRSTPYCQKLVKLVMDQHLEPLIVFSFSKKDCEFYAGQLAKMDLNEGELFFYLDRASGIWGRLLTGNAPLSSSSSR